MSEVVAKQTTAEPSEQIQAYRSQPSQHHADAVFISDKVSTRPAEVAILLCTYNGRHFLSDQLESIAEQSYPHWKIYASDDASQDDTPDILDQYRVEWGGKFLSVYPGPAEGYVRNFLSLVCNASIMADFYAYADQDDIWEKNKLLRALQWLESVPKNVPALFCSRTRLVNANNHDIGFSPLFTKAPSFSNALVQNIGGGNTMVFNDAARRLLLSAGDNIGVVSHDWWSYLVVTACGGIVHYDPELMIRYRQHGRNEIGSNNNLCSRFKRIHLLFKGRFRTWSEQNIQALQRIRPLITPENRQLLDQFASARHRLLIPRLVGMRRSKIHRQTIVGNLTLVAAILLKKI